jgi:hypothetical protein
VEIRKSIFRVLFFLAVAGILIGGVRGWVYHSKEYRAANSIAEKYAKQNNLPSDLTCVSAVRNWTKRGDYNLSCFVFLPKDEFSTTNLMNNYNFAHFIFVRYSDKCPLNTFEVGIATNPNAKNCLTNNAISGAKFISPP